MNVSIILAHPNPNSFNHAIAAAAAGALKDQGCGVHFHDLYAERFDPLLPAGELGRDPKLCSSVARHCEEIASADGIVVVHPNWWGMPPAVLKGWIDRVLRPEIAYRFVANDKGEGVPHGLLKAAAAVVFNTANTPDDREREVFGDPLETLWKRCIFALCGVRSVRRRTFSVVVTSTPQERAAWLDEVKRLVCDTFPVASRTKQERSTLVKL